MGASTLLPCQVYIPNSFSVEILATIGLDSNWKIPAVSSTVVPIPWSKSFVFPIDVEISEDLSG